MVTLHRTPDLFALSEIRGPVLRPGDDGYAEELTGFNVAARRAPDVVVGATGADDVVTALRWASATGTPVAVQATGHGANFPVDHGLLISTRRMTGVRVDPERRTATVGAGARWRDVMAAAAPHGLAGLCGSSSDVGAVGYTVGGGLPVLGRAYGYASDLVRSFRVVTPDGTLHETDAGREPDLFRALRGGKHAVGVVTSMVTELLPLRTLLGGGLWFPGEHAEAVLSAWCGWIRTVPDEMCTTFALLRLPPIPQIPEPLRGRFWARVTVAWAGDPADGEALLAPVRAAAPAAVDTVEVMPCTEIDRIHMDPQGSFPVRESGLLLHELTPVAVRTFLDQVGPDVIDCPLLLVEIRHLGGALSRPSPGADMVSARDADHLLQTVAVVASPAEALAADRAATALHTAMSPYGTGRTTPNMHGAPGDAADRARAWTPQDHADLLRLKHAHDPAGLLRFGHTP
ncbi:FAD-binding oxidoreductase [Streptomyces althioticus]|uniref:FAD-binding oxidoreductase n=1 Tax=Streptomyces althioticus TaxID=83380 RepID=UPI003873C836|nr:FAD-dependent oxidoreductase [Streptomyces althioticus]